MSERLAAPVRWHSMATLGSSMRWLETRMATHGIVVQPTSPFAEARSTIDELIAGAASGRVLGRCHCESGYLFGQRIGRIVAQPYAVDVLTKMVHRGHDRGLPEDRGWLRDLAEGHFPTDHAAREVDEDQRDNLWEYALAGACATFATDVVRDEKPDVICTFDGLRVGIAAKVVASATSLLNPLQRGVEQIGNSPIDCGIIAINLVRLIDAPNMLGNLWQSKIDSHGRQISELKHWLNRYMTERLRPGALALLHRRPKTDGVVFFVPALGLTRDAGSLAPMNIYTFDYVAREDGRRLSDAFYTRLHDAFQDAHGYGISVSA